MTRSATISLVSYPPLPKGKPDRLAKTLERMAHFVGEAKQMGSDLAAFPEICNVLGSRNEWAAEPLDGPTVKAMSEAARKYGVYVVCPLYTREEGRVYNSSVLLGRDGHVVGVYHKNFPTHGELDHGVIPGTETPVFETDFGRVGLAICFDLNYWEVGASLCANKAELVIWSSMWPGDRMLTKWSIEFGFQMGAAYSGRSSFVDVAGRELASIDRRVSDAGGVAPIVMAQLDLDQRLLHHDKNVPRLKALTAKYGPTAVQCEWLENECLLVISSRLPDRSTDQLLAEFGLEPMRDYLARVRRDRQAALDGTYRRGGVA